MQVNKLKINLLTKILIMTIQAKHFDVRLNQWIHLDNDSNNEESLLQEKLSNTLLERFLPDKEFSFGHIGQIDTQLTAKQLENHPNGDKLLLSSKTRLLYGPEECLEVIDQLCPDRKDRGAYGSIFLGGCRNAIDIELNVLVVDDSNGDNGGIIDNEQAYKLTGDCYGQIADEVYQHLTGHKEGDKYRVIQHRFGWTPEDGDDNKFRFGKGTFRPANLDELNYVDTNKPEIDVIIPISSFKGTDKDNPNSPEKPQIKPGLYKQKIWIGEKSQSELGKTAISQVIASFPKGVKDFTEQIELEAKKLAEAEKDPRQLAQLYCEKYERRKDYLENEADELEEEINEEFNQDKQNNVDKLRERLNNDSFIYKVIKEDLANNCQLLETEKVKNELTKFVQGEWRDIAIGKKLQFERALVIPSKDLNDGEIFIPKYNEGEEVLNFRSPFLNSNGMCVSTNKVVENALGPDGKLLEGIIVVSDETSPQIYQRLSNEVEEILPDAKAQGIQINGIEEYLNQDNYSDLSTDDKVEFTDRFNEYIKVLNENGFDIKSLPYESEQERQARDYDGDCIGFEKASKYPNLTAEAIERNLPENAYEPTVKLKKASFYDEQGSQPSFETIAKHMSDGVSVGIINNHLTSVEALESEMEIIKEYGDIDTQAEYVNNISKHYEGLFKKEDKEKVETLIPDKYRQCMNEVIKYAKDASSIDIDKPQLPLMRAMDANKNLYRELIADAAYQNQIAVDLFKSATTPDIDSINQNSRLLHRNVNYIKDKKNKKVYDTETINVTGCSPVELLIAKTNQYFKGSQLESRPLSQFQDFFKGVDYTNQQRMQATIAKKEFDTAFNAATRFSKRRETEKGPSVELKLKNGKILDVSNLLAAGNQEIWDAKSIKIKVLPIDSSKINNKRPHKYAVYAQINGKLDKSGQPEFSKLGNISKEQEFNFIKEVGTGFNTVHEVESHKFQPELSEGQAKLLYNQAYEVAKKFYESIPEQDRKSIAAAAWAVSTTRESVPKEVEESEVGKEINKAKKVSNFIFVAFENEIIERTNKLQLELTKVIKFDKNSPIFNQDTEIRYNVDSEGKDVIEVKNESGEYETFADLEAQTTRLPIGTKATAKAEFSEIFTATATTQIPGKPPLEIKINELIKYELGQQPFDKEQFGLEIQRIDRPQEDYVIYGKDGKGNSVKVGRIDDNSVKEGIAQGWLQEKPGSGQNLQLKLTSIASGKNAYVVAETPDGNMLRVNLDKKLAGRDFKDTNYRNVTMKAHGVSNVYMAAINGKPLGKIGVMPRSGQTKNQSLLAARSILGNQISTKIPVILQSNQTTATITLDKETIQYPEQWVKRHNLLNVRKESADRVEKNNEIIVNKINSRPTILFQDDKQKKSDKIGLAIDENRLENTKLYLDKKDIKYELIPKERAKIEARKGMAVLAIEESTINKEIMGVLLERSGGTIKDNNYTKENIPIVKEQDVYFSDPVKKTIGFVVPKKNIKNINKWLDKKGAEFNILEQENSNNCIILAKENSLSYYTVDNLDNELGKPINITTIEGFDKYETDSRKLSEAKNIKTPSSSVQLSEYQKLIKEQPNRPKKLAEEENTLAFAPASPLEPTESSIKIQTSNNTQKILSDKALIYKLVKDDEFSMPPQSIGIENANSLDSSPTRTGIEIKLETYSHLGDDQQSTVIAVDFRELQKTRDLLIDKNIKFNEPIGINYAVKEVDSLTKLLNEKGYYPFIIDDNNISNLDLEEINQSANVQYNFTTHNEACVLDDNLKEYIEKIPNVDESLSNTITQYIEDENLFLEEWHSHVEKNVDDYINTEYPPTTNVINFIDKVPSLSKDKLNAETAKLNILEINWIKKISEKNINVPGDKSGAEWDAFVEEIVVNNFDKLANKTEYYRSNGVEEVKEVIKLEQESSQSLDGKKFKEVEQRKIDLIDKYGKESYEFLERKAHKQLQKESEADFVINFKGLHNANSNKNYGGVVISKNGKQINEYSQYVGEGTNQQAEYQALILALKKAKELDIKNVVLASDSQNTVLQLQGSNKVKSGNLIPLHEEAKKLTSQFNKVEFKQVSKSENDLAKGLAKYAMERAHEPARTNSFNRKAKQDKPSIDTSNFTEEQKAAYGKISEFLKQPKNGNSEENEFLLTGYAGTGKTYTLVKTLQEVKGLKVCFTAPTNPAAKVARKMAKEQQLDLNISTTHSLLELKQKYDSISGEVFYEEDKRKTGKVMNYDAVVVDESSMVNKQLRGMLKEVAQKGVKVIYMGDPAQLPPVNEEESETFKVKNSAHLTKVMRYSGDIAKVAESIRDDLNNDNPQPILSSEDGQIVSLNKTQFKDEIVNLFKSDDFKLDNSCVKVLAYTNKRVDYINQYVKDELFGKDAPEYIEGLRLIARDPVVKRKGKDIEVLLHNSDEFTIDQARKIEENGYQVWELTGKNEEDKDITFKTVARESKDQFEKDIKALFSAENKKEPKNRDYGMVYAFKEQYANVRPAYAITVHNSQGKTIKKGGIDEENINVRLAMALKETNPEQRARGIKEHQQLRYVAASRFQEKIITPNAEREKSIGIEDKLAKAHAILGKTKSAPSPEQDTEQAYEWARYAPKGKEGYELSSAGDKRFSALNAKLQDGRTIEEAYQLDVKGYRSQGNDWRLGKGKAPLTPMTKEESYQQYRNLWKQWANENPHLINELAQKSQGKLLTDKFASTDISQARALAEILNERNTESTLQNSQPPTTISLLSSKEADKSKSLEIIGKVNESKLDQLRQHLETNYKPLMDADKSNYAPGRQVAWVGAKWELKDKDFSPAVKDDKLMELVKQVYPDADIALVTYSEQAGQGIDYHRDDSYAAAEARSINIGESMWGYQESKQGMVAWDPKANENAPVQEFKLESGTVTRFNSKNPHAALETSAGRWSVNIWSIKNDLGKSNSVREKFYKFQASNQPPAAVVKTNNDLTIKNSEWTPGGEIKIERSYPTRQEANTAGIIRIGDATQARAATPQIPENPQISGKPIPMTWELNQPPELKNITTTIDAMRGNGRVHSTRAQNYYQTYGIKEGDIAIAKGKENKQVAFRVGRQYKITQAMINNPDYQKAWQNWEKHSVKELTENQAAKGKERQLYGLFMKPLGDYQNGKIIPFEQHKQQERTLNITFDGASRNNGKPNAQASAAAVLTNPEGRTKQVSQYLGNRTNNEAEFQAAIIGMKAAQEFGYKSIQIQGDSQLVVEALQGKRNIKAANLKPLYEEAKTLLQSFDKAEISYIPREQNKAADALANKTLDNAQNTNPIGNLEPITEATAKHMVKDKAMAQVATQYIGISAAPPNTPSSTRNYAEAWGDKANTGSYTNKDTIMVSGSGPWRGVTQSQIEENFYREYIPLLDKAIEAKSSIVVGNAKGTDELVKNYLQEKGYKLEQTKDNYARLSSQTKEISNSQPIKENNSENLIISPSSKELGAVLSNATELAKKSGNLENDYKVSVNGNPEAQAGKYGQETHEFKPAGVPYNSAEHAYHHQAQINPNKDPYKLMVEVLQAKLEQHPRLAKTISKKGGIEYLENAQITNEQDKQWEGKGKNSKFIRALTEAYTNVIEKSALKTTQLQNKQEKSNSDITDGIVINSRSSSSLGAALTSTTVKSKQLGATNKDYKVSFRENIEIPKGTYGPETYTEDKPAGQPFASAEQAFYAYKETVGLGESRVNLLAEIQQAKFEQNPELIEQVKENGGVDWLKKCEYKVGGKNNYWEGRSENSPYIRSLIKGYENAIKIEKQNEQIKSTPVNNNLNNQNEVYAQTEINNSPINVSATETPIQQINTPQDNNLPRSDKGQIPAFGTMDSIVEKARNNTLEMLSGWKEIAQKLGKDEEYLSKIDSSIEEYETEGIGIENAFLAMAKDMKELEKLNDVTRMVQRIANTVGNMDNNNVLSAKTTDGYQFAIASNEKNLLVYDKPENGKNILLYIKEGEVKVNDVDDNFTKDLKMMNFKIDNALSDVKNQLVV